MSKHREEIKKRFSELAIQADAIPLRGNDRDVASEREFHAWAVSALHVMASAFGKQSPHYTRFEVELEKVGKNYVYGMDLNVFRGIFFGAKSDVDGGYLFDFQAAISGEIFGDFVTLAKSALENGNHTVAAVLAAAALEDALKRYAVANSLDVENKTMDEVINSLKSKGLVSGAQKGLLGAMPKIRNHAMHAQWEKLTPQDTGSLIGFVEQFLLVNF